MRKDKILEKISNSGLIEILKNDNALYDTEPTEVVENLKAKDLIILQILMDRILNE